MSVSVILRQVQNEPKQLAFLLSELKNFLLAPYTQLYNYTGHLDFSDEWNLWKQSFKGVWTPFYQQDSQRLIITMDCRRCQVLTTYMMLRWDASVPRCLGALTEKIKNPIALIWHCVTFSTATLTNRSPKNFPHTTQWSNEGSTTHHFYLG